MTSLWTAIFETEAWSPIPTIFSESCEMIPWVLVPRSFYCWKFSGTERFTQKITFFANFRAHTLKNVPGSSALNFWCHQPSTYLVWSVIPQCFQGHLRSWSGVNRLASRSFQSQATQILAHTNSRFWDVFFAQNRFSWTNGQLLPIHTIHILKAIVPAVNLAYLGTLYMHPVTCPILCNILGINWYY